MNVSTHPKIPSRTELGDGIKTGVMLCESKEFGQVMTINVLHLRGNKAKI